MFETLGLSTAAEQLYLELLERPGARPDALTRSDRDPDAVGAAIGELREAGLLLPGPGCTAVAPDVAVELLAHRQEELLRRARAAVEPLLLRYRQVGSPDPVELVAGSEQVSLRYEQLVRCARKEILGFDKPPYVVPVRDLGMELASLGQRVRYRAVYARPALTMPGRLSDVDTLKSAGEQARILPDLPFKLLIVDRRWAMVPVSEGTEVERAMVVRPCSLLDALVATFDSYWQRAVPFGDAGRASTPGGQTAPDDLSEADRQVLALLATGLTDERIAAHLGLGLRTVQRRVRGLMDRLGAGNRFQAGLQAARTGLL
jgi:DNA-binding CsgD family transcriptional regulator